MYLHADMRLKEKALSKTAPLGVRSARYHPDDKLLEFMENRKRMVWAVSTNPE
jgi:hypothetical protein